MTKPANHRYPSSAGMMEFRQAVADWYGRRFGVTLDAATEVVSLIGSKEGVANMAVAYVDPGDVVLVPTPAYPVYEIGTKFNGGEVYFLPLRRESGFLPDLSSIPADVLKWAKMLWLNYPNNPTGAVADEGFLKEAVEFARRHGIILCHDAAYTELGFDGYRAPSILQVEGAKEVAIEFHSLSKTFNMTGWRSAMAVGCPELVATLAQVKSNVDSGVFPAGAGSGHPRPRARGGISGAHSGSVSGEAGRVGGRTPPRRLRASGAQGDLLRLAAGARGMDLHGLYRPAPRRGRHRHHSRQRFRRARRGFHPDDAVFAGGPSPGGGGAAPAAQPVTTVPQRAYIGVGSNQGKQGGELSPRRQGDRSDAANARAGGLDLVRDRTVGHGQHGMVRQRSGGRRYGSGTGRLS